jgi:hypothetical protein
MAEILSGAIWKHIQRQDVAQGFAGRNTKLAFQELAVQASFAKVPEHLMNVSHMCRQVVGVHQDVIKLHHSVNIKQICKESVEKVLEGSW